MQPKHWMATTMKTKMRIRTIDTMMVSKNNCGFEMFNTIVSMQFFETISMELLYRFVYYILLHFTAEVHAVHIVWPNDKGPKIYLRNIYQDGNNETIPDGRKYRSFALSRNSQYFFTAESNILPYHFNDKQLSKKELFYMRFDSRQDIILILNHVRNGGLETEDSQDTPEKKKWYNILWWIMRLENDVQREVISYF